MPEITVNIAGRPYRMACGEGEEDHLNALASDFDRRISALRQHFGEVGDSRLLIMAALTVGDDLAEARRRLAQAEETIAGLRDAQRSEQARVDKAEAAVAARMEQAAATVERMVEMLDQPSGSR
ncbi:MAG: cell division protein ZapA [Rhodobiaceae bacterium]|nr:cell division protein ZapA [Rhodobiaceae bacterium]MCC0015448.1 cell division protein ZapA [Rhodobiaceae bacterium]MCC0040986.1 cell division protein ZapA [Rhodobiaceae bacterium]MCC0053313.1 cell division protein ZapA [Rhodobiaceae bacterium]